MSDIPTEKEARDRYLKWLQTDDLLVLQWPGPNENGCYVLEIEPTKVQIVVKEDADGNVCGWIFDFARGTAPFVRTGFRTVDGAKLKLLWAYEGFRAGSIRRQHP